MAAKCKMAAKYLENMVIACPYMSYMNLCVELEKEKKKEKKKFADQLATVISKFAF